MRVIQRFLIRCQSTRSLYSHAGMQKRVYIHFLRLASGGVRKNGFNKHACICTTIKPFHVSGFSCWIVYYMTMNENRSNPVAGVFSLVSAGYTGEER
jgi:hypothetical protein